MLQIYSGVYIDILRKIFLSFNLHTFTIDLKNNNTINYPDITIHKQCDILQFNILRKPTYEHI